MVEELGRAEVPTLSVYNPTSTPVLIVEGEHFLGGKQNRSVNTTVLVSGKTKLNIPVTCLEQGRWGRRREYTRAPSFTAGANPGPQPGGGRCKQARLQLTRG